MNDLVINKVASLRRCVARARQEYAANPEGFATDYTRQDAALLNVLRACEMAIDVANHLVRKRKLGVPQSSAEAFEFLADGGIISPAFAQRLTRMVAFRNILVHGCTDADMAIIIAVITRELDELLEFARIALGRA